MRRVVLRGKICTESREQRAVTGVSNGGDTFLVIARMVLLPRQLGALQSKTVYGG
jgi:hypothetical protein